jgi:hypothetical protein
MFAERSCNERIQQTLGNCCCRTHLDDGCTDVCQCPRGRSSRALTTNTESEHREKIGPLPATCTSPPTTQQLCRATYPLCSIPALPAGNPRASYHPCPILRRHLRHSH